MIHFLPRKVVDRVMEDAKTVMEECSIQETRSWLSARPIDSKDSRIESLLDQDDLRRKCAMGFARFDLERSSLKSMEASRLSFTWYNGRGIA